MHLLQILMHIEMRKEDFLFSFRYWQVDCIAHVQKLQLKKNAIVQHCDNLDNCCFLFLLMLIVWEH